LLESNGLGDCTAAAEWDPAFLSQVVDGALPPRVFVDDPTTHLDIPRIGGTLSHLKTEYAAAIKDGTTPPPAPHELVGHSLDSIPTLTPMNWNWKFSLEFVSCRIRTC
jgi:hypothetical protein